MQYRFFTYFCLRFYAINMINPVVHVYVVCRNEIDILPFFIAHYEKIADKIVVYDNQSTDGSIEYVLKHPLCTLVEFNTGDLLRDDILRFIKNSAWKESIGISDWVIVCDIDEFLFHKNLIKNLALFKSKGITIPYIEGFNMISEDFPVPGISIIEQVRHGAYSRQFSKHILFDPNKISEINYSAGGHTIEPEGVVKFGGKLKLLHYKYLGSKKRLQERWTDFGIRLSKVNIDNKWGVERTKPEVILSRIDYVKKNAELVVDFSYCEWRSKSKRFFRKRKKETLC